MRKRQFLVLGLGRFGSSVAKTLCELGQEVMAVDSEEQNVNEVAPYVTQAAQLDATDEAALGALGVDNYDAAVVSIGQNTRDSILICVLLKELGIPYLIAKANDDLHAKVLMKLGVDKVVFPERDMGTRVAHAILTPNTLDLMSLGDGYQLLEIKIPEKWVGGTIGGINVRRTHGVSILAIHRGDEYIVAPVADTMFAANDTLLVLGENVNIERLES